MNRVTVPVLVVGVRRVVVFNFASLTLAQMLFNRSCCVLLLGDGARKTRTLSDLFLSGNFFWGGIKIRLKPSCRVSAYFVTL